MAILSWIIIFIGVCSSTVSAVMYTEPHASSTNIADAKFFSAFGALLIIVGMTIIIFKRIKKSNINTVEKNYKTILTSMKCLKCGNIITESEKFCPKCGNDLIAQSRK